MCDIPPSMLQCQALVAEGAILGESPAAVVAKCDITFGMLSDPDAALQVRRSQCPCIQCNTRSQHLSKSPTAMML